MSRPSQMFDRHTLREFYGDEYDGPDDEEGTCAACGKTCRVVWVDNGIGADPWGVHHSWQRESGCCGDRVEI
jgi:hypothetical protein